MRIRRALAACITVGSSLLALADVGAQEAAPPTEQRCLDAYEKGQRLRLKHSLIEARAELLLCARAPCPESFRPECLQWYGEVQRLVPSVVVRVGGDAPQTDVRVTIDGTVAATRLDGTPIEVDPGEHEFRFEPKGRPAIEQTVLIIEGEKARGLTIALPVDPPKPITKVPPRVDGGPSYTPWVFAGIGAVALGSFAFFGATGLSKRHDLDGCNPYCSQGNIDDARRRFLVADISLAISVVSFGIATYGFLSASTAAPTVGARGLRLEAIGGPKAAFLGLSSTF
jgi:hypothetical protein